MTDAPALILVPANHEGPVSTSPYIDGVPVEVVERMARAIFETWAEHEYAVIPSEKMTWSEAVAMAREPDVFRKAAKIVPLVYAEARAALRSAGVKVADNG